MADMYSFLCEECGNPATKPRNEANRSLRLGRRFFCSLRCAALTANRPKKLAAIVRNCRHCGNSFQSSLRKKGATFCSRECASRGSVTDRRRQGSRKGGLKSVANLLSQAETLKRREAWKYVALEATLTKTGRAFEFEYPLANYVFDLALFDKRVLVEFDGPDHGLEKQQKIDEQKTAVAEKYGFVVVRRPVIRASVISPETIKDL